MQRFEQITSHQVERLTITGWVLLHDERFQLDQLIWTRCWHYHSDSLCIGAIQHHLGLVWKALLCLIVPSCRWCDRLMCVCGAMAPSGHAFRQLDRYGSVLMIATQGFILYSLFAISVTDAIHYHSIVLPEAVLTLFKPLFFNKCLDLSPLIWVTHSNPIAHYIRILSIWSHIILCPADQHSQKRAFSNLPCCRSFCGHSAQIMISSFCCLCTAFD